MGKNVANHLFPEKHKIQHTVIMILITVCVGVCVCETHSPPSLPVLVAEVGGVPGYSAQLLPIAAQRLGRKLQLKEAKKCRKERKLDNK